MLVWFEIGQGNHVETAIGTQQTALLVVDVQNAVVETAFDRDGVVERLASVIAKARKQMVPVIYIQHEADEPSMQRGSKGWQIVDRIAPLEGEIVIGKRYGDAFVDTDLKETLEDLDINHLVIGGSESDACVTAALTRALIEGFDVTLLGDGHTTSDRQALDGSIIPAEQIIQHANLRAMYMRYPDAASTVVDSASYEFAQPVAHR